MSENPRPEWILEWDKSKSYLADIKDGVFKATEEFGYARAGNIMNSKSPNDFRWSVYVSTYLAGGNWIDIGIASKLQPIQDIIYDYDQHCILFEPRHVGPGFEITFFFWADECQAKFSLDEPCVAFNKRMEDIINAGSGYNIHLRFQSKLKKLLISMKGVEYSYDIQENVDYFPVIQGPKNATVTLFKPHED